MKENKQINIKLTKVFLVKMSQSNNPLSITEQVEKIKSIKYFTPARTIEEANSLLPKINELVYDHINALGSWKKENDSLQHASDSLWDIARIAAMKAETQHMGLSMGLCMETSKLFC
jgi:hypothetical protein